LWLLIGPAADAVLVRVYLHRPLVAKRLAFEAGLMFNERYQLNLV
jgi:hypothetical protein